MLVVMTSLGVSSAHVEMHWLKASAFSNMLSIVVTFAVLNVSTGWLKFREFLNMELMSLTEEVSKKSTGWLKVFPNELNPSNMDLMLVTADVSNEAIEESKEEVLNI